MSLPSSVNTLVEGNTIINNAESEYIGQKGIYIVDETDSIIRNNTIEGFFNGVYSENSTGVQILNNIISRTIGDAVSLYNVTNFTVSENNITNTLDVGDGVQIVNSTNVTVSNNNINNVTDDGVFFDSSRLISITGNTINGVGDDAIDAENSGDYTIDNNTTSANGSSFEIDGDYIDPSGGEDEVFTERGLSSGWQQRTVDLSAYQGQRIMLSFGFYTDGSVLGADVISHVDGDGPEDAGVYVDDITVNSDGSPLFTDNVESGEGEWSVPSVSGDVWAVVDAGAYNESNTGFTGAHSGTHAWHPQYENNGDNTTFQREIDLTSANSSANLVFYTWYNTESCCDAIFVKVLALSDAAEDSKEITNNVMFSSSTALDLDEVTNLTVLGNAFHADSWVINNESSNLFNDADSGNSWYLFDNTPSWNIYDIKDSNKNGYADEGKDLPFNQTILGVERWSGLGFDAHPATENIANSKKKHSGSVTRQIKNLVNTENAPKIEEVKQTFPNAFNNQGGQGNGGTGNSTSFSRNMEKGAHGSDVKELQKFLNTHGFTIAPNGPGSAGNETDLFGPATQAALIAFQKAQGINPALGYFGPLTKKTIEAMMSGGATTPVTPTQAQVKTDRDMEFGMSGDDVKKLQAFLVAQNTGLAAQALAKNGVSGYFGQLTKDAVIEFQKAKGISPAVGYVGVKTRAYIVAN
jgi:peptidoglycan hydrolase-like protein with peptidoglycan-binding domain